MIFLLSLSEAQGTQGAFAFFGWTTILRIGLNPASGAGSARVRDAVTPHILVPTTGAARVATATKTAPE